MKKTLKFRVRYPILIGFLLVLSIGSSPAQSRTSVLVFAASSLTEAFEALGDAFEATHPDVDVLFNFAGSSTLATQISQGAPADVFASANPAQMQRVRDGGQLASEPFIFAQNRLVLLTPATNPANITTLDDLATPGVRLILASPDVPIRTYTDTLLHSLSRQPGYGAVYVEAVLANRVSEEVNVRQLVAKLVVGEVDAGFAYVSDVTPDIADDVMIVAIPDEINPIATYPIAISSGSQSPEQAARFIDFVRSAVGQRILAERGFLPVASRAGAADRRVLAGLLIVSELLFACESPVSVLFVCD